MTNFKHYFDKNCKTDYIISISKHNSNIKLWNINSNNCLFNVYGYIKGNLDSACFIKDANESFIL